VLEGWLGCSNCRERYRVAGGFAELGMGARPAERGPSAVEAATAEGALRYAALAGITEGPAFLLLLGSRAHHALLVAKLVPLLEVVTLDPRFDAWDEVAGVSRVGANGLPLQHGAFRAVLLTAGAENELESAARVVAPLGRIVIEQAPGDAESRLTRAGLKLVMQDGPTVVAVRK
jgi:hypothetical protein